MKYLILLMFVGCGISTEKAWKMCKELCHEKGQICIGYDLKEGYNLKCKCGEI